MDGNNIVSKLWTMVECNKFMNCVMFENEDIKSVSLKYIFIKKVKL